MEKINKQPYIGMNKWPLMHRVLGYIEDKINELVDWVNGNSLPDPATAEAGQVLGVVDDEYAFVNPPAPTNPKVYRALLTIIPVYLRSGVLEIGKQYFIPSVLGDDDFSNVGFIDTAFPFIATGTTPSKWSNETLIIGQDTSTINVLELQNTIGEINYVVGNSIANWSVLSDGLFIENKSFSSNELAQKISPDINEYVKCNWIDNNTYIISIQSDQGDSTENVLFKYPIEILVYD